MELLRCPSTAAPESTFTLLFNAAGANTFSQLADAQSQREHSDYRTSKNSWLMGKFMADPVVHTVDARIANLTGLYAGNAEHYQYAYLY